ncbi:conserved hypothetical protein [Histoplasma capsulatum var. duboisii H88]|uniref:Uncharacterized protein n=1 Tax=Ajellomyces capsulatus (strain H88) TaxID=544711 RepID=F0UV02_AJEC8|nr:conserved hypothetical protein [Histoplasma capsulatum var. duboisii H88]
MAIVAAERNNNEGSEDDVEKRLDERLRGSRACLGTEVAVLASLCLVSHIGRLFAVGLKLHLNQCSPARFATDKMQSIPIACHVKLYSNRRPKFPNRGHLRLHGAPASLTGFPLCSTETQIMDIRDILTSS